MKKVCLSLCFTCLSLLVFAQVQPLSADTVLLQIDCSQITVYDVVDEEATPVEGMSAFYRFISDQIVYPKEAVTRSVRGTSYFRFVISDRGEVICAEVIEGREIGWGLDEQVIRALSKTKWKPAKQKGEAVNCRRILPVRFY